MPFRLNAKKLFLTYPQCDLMPAVAITLLEQVLAPTYSIIASIACHENHQDGNFHLHLALILNKKCNLTNENCLDIGNFHGNYSSARNWNASVNYIKRCYKNTTASPTAY